MRTQAAPRTGKWTGQEDSLPPALAAKFKAEVAASPVFKATMEAFSDRQRTRRAITLRTLLATIRASGLELEREELVRVLKLLDNNGVGEVVLDRDGKVEGLRDIRYSLWALADATLPKPPPTKLMSVDDIPSGKFVRSTVPKQTGHLANVEGSPLNARPAPATTLVPPGRTTAMVRHTTNAGKPAMKPGAAEVVITIGGEPLVFHVDIATAITLIRQLD